MSNKKPELVECRIKSFESRANESLWVTLDVPLTIARFMTKAASDGIPLRVLVEAVPAVPAQGASASNGKSVPEQIAERVTGLEGSELWLGNVAWTTRQRVVGKFGNELATIRAWLAGLIREGYEAGRMEGVMDRSEAEGLREANCDLTNEVTNLRRSLDWFSDQLAIRTTERDDLALQRERTEDQRCHLAQMLGLDGGASWEDVAPAIAAYRTKAREEGRRQGLRQAADRVQRYLAETQEIGVECDEQIEALREGIKSKEDIRRSIAQKAEAYRTALADLKKQIDKEPA